MNHVSSAGKCGFSFLFLALCIRTTGAEDLSCPRRTLPVALRDQQNVPMQNVSVSDLAAKVRGKPIKILSLAPDTRPHRLVLILDASGSMGSMLREFASPVLLFLLLLMAMPVPLLYLRHSLLSRKIFRDLPLLLLPPMPPMMLFLPLSPLLQIRLARRRSTLLMVLLDILIHRYPCPISL